MAESTIAATGRMPRSTSQSMISSDVAKTTGRAKIVPRDAWIALGLNGSVRGAAGHAVGGGQTIRALKQVRRHECGLDPGFGIDRPEDPPGAVDDRQPGRLALTPVAQPDSRLHSSVGEARDRRLRHPRIMRAA